MFPADSDSGSDSSAARRRGQREAMLALQSAAAPPTAAPHSEDDSDNNEDAGADPRRSDWARAREKAREAREAAREEESRAVRAARGGEELPEEFGPRVARDGEAEDRVEEDEGEEASKMVGGDAARFPLAKVVTLGSRHGAAVTCISLDSAASRFVTSSLDHAVKLWDLGSMDRSLRSFTETQPLGERFPVHTALFSATGGRILVAGGANAAKVLDRDAAELYTCPSGDRYLHDMANTPGHAGSLLAAAWSPKAQDVFATTAEDATVRFWNTSSKVKKHAKIIKQRRGIRATAICYAHDASRIAVGCSDGGISFYDPRAYAARPTDENKEAHPGPANTTSICFSPDDTMLLTRTDDDCLRLWDVRRMDDPLARFDGLENVNANTAAVFSPDGSAFATGTSARRRGGSPARVVVFDRSTLQEAASHACQTDQGSVVALTWNAAINQILYGCADGSVQVLYDPKLSTRGVLRCLEKTTRRKHDAVVNLGPGRIYTPNALPMFRDESGVGPHGVASSDQKRERLARLETSGTRKPQSAEGVVVKPLGSTLASFLAQGTVKKTWTEEDPREALLRLDEKSKAQPLFTGSMQQPTILAPKTAEQEAEEAAERARKRLPEHLQKRPRLDG